VRVVAVHLHFFRVKSLKGLVHRPCSAHGCERGRITVQIVRLKEGAPNLQQQTHSVWWWLIVSLQRLWVRLV
jgi:hypothetical protein